MSVMPGAARLSRAFALLLAICGTALGADPEYQTVALPGFSVEVPKGTVVKNVGTPQAGAYEIAYLPASRRDKRVSPGDSALRMSGANPMCGPGEHRDQPRHHECSRLFELQPAVLVMLGATELGTHG